MLVRRHIVSVVSPGRISFVLVHVRTPMTWASRGMLRRRAQYWRTKRGFAFFCLQEPIYNVLVIFFCSETMGVRPPC